MPYGRNAGALLSWHLQPCGARPFMGFARVHLTRWWGSYRPPSPWELSAGGSEGSSQLKWGNKHLTLSVTHWLVRKTELMLVISMDRILIEGTGWPDMGRLKDTRDPPQQPGVLRECSRSPLKGPWPALQCVQAGSWGAGQSEKWNQLSLLDGDPLLRGCGVSPSSSTHLPLLPLFAEPPGNSWQSNQDVSQARPSVKV